MKYTFSNVWVIYLVWNFKGYKLHANYSYPYIKKHDIYATMKV